ncbi:MAG: DNA repair protein RadA [Caulobacterales bacterium]|nr:DNA repair protein RadA [Caulobacterales bacterium]
MADSAFVCQSCGSVHAKWAGRCDGCGTWNTLVEEAVAAPVGAGATKSKSAGKRRSRGLELVPLAGEDAPAARLKTGIGELDRVLGGGIAESSVILLGGDPGIGKSTLLLQAAARLASAGAGVAYISGEEAIGQVRARARRLGLEGAPVSLASETSLQLILDGLRSAKPDIAVIDSIQTLWSDALPAAPGSIAQVRACAQELTRFAKTKGVAIVLVGHVTKDGQIAGPRAVEHVVDAVLYFEGERSLQFRILRGVKNRYGPTDEIGVFEMHESGLEEVDNPSRLFLAGRSEPASGSIVFAGVEGTRPLLVEIQALVAPAEFGAPRRAVVGWDQGRLAMVLAVLEARCGLSFAGRDVYLNVAGGLKIAEPAADLAVAAALVSAGSDEPLDPQLVAFGEISLSGEVRPVGRAESRLREAAKLGFTAAVTPPGAGEGETKLAVRQVGALSELARLAQDGALAGN